MNSLTNSVDQFDDTKVVRLAALAISPIPALSTFLTGASFVAIALPSLVFAGMAVMSSRSEGQMKAYLLTISIIGQCIAMTAAFAGHPWQIDTHMAFFAALAIVSVLGSIPALLLAVCLTAVHHLSLGLALPYLVYPSTDLLGNLGRTVFHALIVLFEAGILLLSMIAVQRQRQKIADSQAELVETAERAENAKVKAEILGRQSRLTADQTRELGREAAVAIEAIASVAKTAAANAENSKELVSRARNDVEKSEQIVRKTTMAMEGIKESSDGISRIVELIDEIARRTDLLALNAAVESARAGEAGRGFAVVAKEVRKLAQQSADATLQIRTLVGTSGRRVKDGAELAVEAERSLQRIMAAVAELDQRMQDIASGAAEQSQGLQQMSVAISRMDNIGADGEFQDDRPVLRLAS